MQHRGVKRRELLKAAVRQLLTENDISDVTFADIAKEANIPKSSAYHFYANIDEIYTEVAIQYGELLLEELSKIPTEDEVNTWHDIVDILVTRAIHFYQTQTPARQLFISGKTSASIKQKDRKNDEEIAIAIFTILDHFFHLPSFDRQSDIFFIWVEIVDTIFTISQMKYGIITKGMESEAKRAAKAYLGTYLPIDTPLRVKVT
ncbi:TetR/AcrR family transcriptional regulator [Vibrio tapetis]|uniref:Transcriptional regulator, TetR family n=1 Tax=Vibrio tapetis subsp. tapetis TaxID=1671868 RepID=A0A2N8ZCS4_9VIBR|nr:TetR/AcrR family transcriptional regulator [Vibrio tapetis]SON49696.1 Transcriptional regulator, TetR family [Vibrio tapetis subsp. tapetis]